MPGLPAVEPMVHQPGPAGFGEKFGAEADQASSRHQILHPHPAGPVVDHLLEAALARGEHLGDHTDVLLGRVDAHALDGLAELSVDFACNYLRVADGELESLAAH